ncbi:O-antigen ligase family protein [bacterium]|nr:O-antigen ligase family protein [bacterium]
MATFLLSMYVVVLFIRPMEWWGPLMHFQLVTAAAYTTVLVSFPRVLQDHLLIWRRIPQVRIAIALLFAATISWVYPLWLTGMRLTFEEFGKIIVFYMLIILHGRKPRTFRIVLWTVLLCVGWMALHGILQHYRGVGFGGKEPTWRGLPGGGGVYQIRAFGFFDDPNDLCLVFIIAIPLLWAAFRSEAKPGVRLGSLLMIPLSAYGAWLTNSRGGIVGIFGMLGAYAIARAKGMRRWLIAVVGVVAVLVLAPVRVTRGMGIDMSRIYLWGEGLAMWKGSPIFGVGYGYFGAYSSEEKAAHNSYVQVLGELGLLGYIPFILLIYLTMMHLRRAINLGNLIPKRERTYLTGLFSALAGYLTAIYFISRQYNHVLYAMLGLALCQVMIVCREEELYQRVLGAWRRDLRNGIVFALASVAVLYFSIRLGSALGSR